MNLTEKEWKELTKKWILGVEGTEIKRCRKKRRVNRKPKKTTVNSPALPKELNKPLDDAINKLKEKVI